MITANPIRVILADDHAVVRQGIRDFLEEAGDIQVIAEASDGMKAKELLLKLHSDVAILDVRMPGMTGIEVTRWVRHEHLPVKVLILSAYDDDPFVFAAMQAGANGYVLKNAEADEITAAVRKVAQGLPALTPEIAQKLHHPPYPQSPNPLITITSKDDLMSLIEPLSDREREVLQLAAAGMTNRAIGSKLVISDRTVQGHLASIYGKLGVNSRTEAVTKALQLGMIHLPD